MSNWDYYTWLGARAMWAGAAVGGFWGIAVAALYLSQRRIVFPRPPPDMILDPAARGGRIITHKGATAVFYPPREGHNTIVFWHGNGDQIGGLAAHLGKLIEENSGLGFMGIEYPGYGVAEGEPSEESCLRTSEDMLRHLTTDAPGGLGVNVNKTVLMGQSIGCAVALDMALRGYGGRLILVSPFTSLMEMAVALFPLVRPVLTTFPFFLKDKFDNRVKSKLVRVPTLVVHGRQDEIVPFDQGTEVASLIRDSEFVPFDMGHNNVYEPPHGSRLIQFMVKFALEHQPHKDDDGPGASLAGAGPRDVGLGAAGSSDEGRKCHND